MPVDEPQSHTTTTDPLTAILVSVTEMRGDLRAALSEIKRHSDDITHLYKAHNSLRDRVVTLETRQQTESQSEQRGHTRAGVAWQAVAALATAAALVLAILVAVRTG